MVTKFDLETQKLFLEIMISDGTCYTRVQNIFDPTLFDKKYQKVAQYIAKHSNDYQSLPTVKQIKAGTGEDLDHIDSIDEPITEWFLDHFEAFIKHESLKRAIFTSADMIEKGDYDPVEKIIKDAVQISLTRDLGIDYFEDPKGRLQEFYDSNGQFSTGWKNLDDKLFGGFNRGEIEIFAGGSGAGKSLFLQNIAINWIEQGHNGVYISLELSENLCAMRMDSMVTGIPTKEIKRDLDKVELTVKAKGKKAGHLRVKKMPAQSTVNDLRSYIKELQIQQNLKLSFVCVDYLDLLMPVSVKVNPNDVFIKDKYVTEELRNLAEELSVVLVSASQLNRGAVEEIEFNHSHISGGISKINTADNVMGIFTSRSMREQGRYQLQMMKTRNSDGFGQKVELEFDPLTLRIVDAAHDASYETAAPNATNIMDDIKNASSSPTPAKSAGVNGDKLQSMLDSLKR